MQTTTLDVFQACDCCALSGIPLTTHHILPRSKGGTDLPSNVVRVCEDCHGVIHGTAVFSAELIREGLDKAKARGVKLGRPTLVTEDVKDTMRGLRAQGLSYKAVAEQLGWSVGAVHKACKAS